MKKEKALLEYYNSRPLGGTRMRTKKALQAVFSVAGVVLESEADVLDLGCARGVMAEIMRKDYGADVMAVDFASSRISIGRDRYPEVIFVEADMHDFVETAAWRFNLITLFDTLEHLEDPATLVGKCKLLLFNSGVILAKTPLNHTDTAHLQVYLSKEDFDQRLKPDRSYLHEGSVVAVWGGAVANR